MSLKFLLYWHCLNLTVLFLLNLTVVYVFIDPPEPPTRLKVGLVTKNSVALTWRPPKNDGGAPVTHYIIERLVWDRSGEGKETWKQCNKRDVEETKFIVEDLKEGGEYEFRVRAVNEAGNSKPSSTAGPVAVKDQTCM